MVEHACLLAFVALASAPQLPAQERRIIVKEGDTLIVGSGVTARIVRSRAGEVRLALSADGKELVMTVDDSARGGPDGLVDRVYRFQLQQEFPSDLLWRGPATIEEIDTITDGDVGRAGGPTLITPNGRIKFSAWPADEEASVTTIRTGGAQIRGLSEHYGGSRAFDEVEHAWLNHLEDSLSRVRTSLEMSVGPQAGGVVVTREPPDVPAGRAPAADTRVVARAQELRGNPRFTLPRVLTERKPQYTPGAMRRKVQGIVELEATVGIDGAVADVKVTRPLDPDLDRAAMEAARGWRFTPATLDGAPIPVVVTIEMTFTLKQ
jgi:TonB family protein